ncbi:MAG: hypothetical protein OXT74_07510 [Candidatus Poribacteria bacterium]|nr:hypothetical protein [Candidatus Poribacteria bacterium]
MKLKNLNSEILDDDANLVKTSSYHSWSITNKTNGKLRFTAEYKHVIQWLNEVNEWKDVDDSATLKQAEFDVPADSTWTEQDLLDWAKENNPSLPWAPQRHADHGCTEGEQYRLHCYTAVRRGQNHVKHTADNLPIEY